MIVWEKMMKRACGDVYGMGNMFFRGRSEEREIERGENEKRKLKRG